MVNISLLEAVEILGPRFVGGAACGAIQVCACSPLILHANEALARVAGERVAIA
jgi:hypothetical protein